MSAAKATIDHDEIRKWAEKHRARPAHVKTTAKKGETGILRLDWDFAITSSSTPDDLAPEEGGPSDLTIALEDLELDVGTYLSKFLKPIFGDVKRFLEPFKPIVPSARARFMTNGMSTSEARAAAMPALDAVLRNARRLRMLK